MQQKLFSNIDQFILLLQYKMRSNEKLRDILSEFEENKLIEWSRLESFEHSELFKSCAIIHLQMRLEYNKCYVLKTPVMRFIIVKNEVTEYEYINDFCDLLIK